MTTTPKKDTRKDLTKDKYGTRIATMTVKAKDGAMVYDSNGIAIPGDQFVSVPVSATLVMAVRNGDLEEMEAEPASETKPSESSKRTTTTKTSE